MEYVEALRSVLPPQANPSPEDEVSGSSSMISPLEVLIDTLSRSFFRWYQDLQFNRNEPPPLPSPPQMTDSSSTSTSLPPPLPSSSTRPTSPLRDSSSPTSTIPLYRSITVLKDGLLFYRPNHSTVWSQRYCLLTEDAFYISSYTSPPISTSSSIPPPGSPTTTQRSSTITQHSVIVIPLTVLYLYSNLNEINEFQTFAVWSPLSFGLLGVLEENHKQEWLSLIEVCSSFFVVVVVGVFF